MSHSLPLALLHGLYLALAITEMARINNVKTAERTGAPMTHYMREGIALVLEKHGWDGGARKRKA